MSLRRASVIALALAAAACSAIDDDNTGSIEQDKRIDPKDNENLGRLTVEAPAGWTLPPNPDDDATATWKGSNNLKLGTTLRTNAETACIEVQSKFAGKSKVCGVEVKKKTLTTVKLAAVRAKYDPALLAVDFGPAPTFTIFHTEGGSSGKAAPEYPIYAYEYGRGPNLAFWRGTGPAADKGVLAAPGDYRFWWSLPILGEVKKTLAQGDDATVDLVPNDVRATIELKAPATRELPNAPTNACQTKDRTFVVQRNAGAGEPAASDQKTYQQNPQNYPNGAVSTYSRNEGIVAFRALPVTNTTSLKVFPFTATEGTMHYDVVVNSVVQSLDVKPGKTTTVQLERLDMNDVEVEREDGSTYLEKGKWIVWRKDDKGEWKPITQRAGQYSDCSGNGGATQASFPTGTGIDVLPGEYRIQVDYKTAEGMKNQEYVVSLP